jgi:O-antigen/teichoic acid export membrane protein
MAMSVRTKKRTGKTGSTGKGITFSAMAGIASLVAGVVLLPIVITTVGADAYGTWLFLLAAATFLFFLDLGVGTAVVHYISRSRSGDRTSDPNSIASTAHAWALGATAVAIAVFLLLGWSHAEDALHNVSHEELVILICCGVALLASMTLRPMSSVLFGAGYLHIERRNQIVGVALRIVGTLVACFGWSSVTGVAIAETVALITPTILSAYSATNLKIVRLNWTSISRAELGRMFSYSIGAFSVSMVGAAVLQFGTLIIGLIGTPSQVTYFNAAFRIYVSVRQIIGWLTDPFRSVLSRLYVSSPLRARSVLYDLLFVSFITSALGCIFLMVALPSIVKIWLGSSVPLDEVVLASSALLAGLVLNSMHLPLIPASDAAGSPGAFLPHQLAWLASYAGLSLFFFPLLGIAGVALAMTLPLPALEFAYLVRSRKTVGLDFETWYRRVIHPALPILLFGVIAATASRLVNSDFYAVLAVGAIYVTVSLLALFLTRRKWRHATILESLRLES